MARELTVTAISLDDPRATRPASYDGCASRPGHERPAQPSAPRLRARGLDVAALTLPAGIGLVAADRSRSFVEAGKIMTGMGLGGAVGVAGVLIASALTTPP